MPLYTGNPELTRDVAIVIDTDTGEAWACAPTAARALAMARARAGEHDDGGWRVIDATLPWDLDAEALVALFGIERDAVEL